MTEILNLQINERLNVKRLESYENSSKVLNKKKKKLQNCEFCEISNVHTKISNLYFEFWQF